MIEIMIEVIEIMIEVIEIMIEVIEIMIGEAESLKKMAGEIMIVIQEATKSEVVTGLRTVSNSSNVPHVINSNNNNFTKKINSSFTRKTNRSINNNNTIIKIRVVISLTIKILVNGIIARIFR